MLVIPRFLWKLMADKRLRVYKWTGKNDYMALCEADYISFGGGSVLTDQDCNI